jgi:outer membrane protein TolC
MRHLKSITTVALLLTSPIAIAEPVFTLEQFLQEVRRDNTEVRGTQESKEGALDRAAEAKLVTAVNFFANGQFENDERIPTNFSLSYSSIITNTFSLGFSDTTPFGLQAKLSYNYNYFNLINPIFFGTLPTQGPLTGFPGPYSATPMLELTQNLWSNGGGRGTQANQELLEAQALSTSYNSSFQNRTDLVNAEAAYWQLVTARQTVRIERVALDRAQKLYDYNAKRVRLQLADLSDALQSEALLKLRQLDLQTALDNERVSATAFNSARNINSETVPEFLPDLDYDQIQSMHEPTRVAMRDDVKAAEQLQRVTVANAVLGQERDSPTLDLYGSVALNGNTGTLNSTWTNGFSAGRPTEIVGVRFILPLDIGTWNKAKEGWEREKLGADLNYQRKFFDQEDGWKDLQKRLLEARKRLELTRAIEVAQEAKLRHEKDRLTKGRTTTYNVLTFEEDYNAAQVSRLQAQLAVLNVLTQMKLYGDSV